MNSQDFNRGFRKAVASTRTFQKRCATKNPFDDERADDEFVAATKDAKLRKVRKRNNVCLLILVVVALFLMSLKGKNLAALDTWFYAFVISTSLASSLYIDLQIKFLKATRG